MPRYVSLAIREDQGKGIPYLSGYGFKVLKGNPSAVDSVPEAADHEPFRQALLKINQPSTPFFSVGCEKYIGANQDGYGGSGYIDLCFNHLDLAQDVSRWFALFWEFSAKCIHWQSDPNLVNIIWELETDVLTDVGEDAYACTAAVWVVTTPNPDQQSAENLWAEAWRFIGDFFGEQIIPAQLPAIYPLRQPPQV